MGFMGGADEGHEEEEDRGHFRQGDEGGGADEGHEDEEDRDHFRQGDEGGGADEGHEEEEDRDHFRQCDEGGGADEGHEVSWTSGSALYAPACASSSCVGISALVSSMGRMRD